MLLCTQYTDLTTTFSGPSLFYQRTIFDLRFFMILFKPAEVLMENIFRNPLFWIKLKTTEFMSLLAFKLFEQILPNTLLKGLVYNIQSEIGRRIYRKTCLFCAVTKQMVLLDIYRSLIKWNGSVYTAQLLSPMVRSCLYWTILKS